MNARSILLAVATSILASCSSGVAGDPEAPPPLVAPGSQPGPPPASAPISSSEETGNANSGRSASEPDSGVGLQALRDLAVGWEDCRGDAAPALDEAAVVEAQRTPQGRAELRELVERIAVAQWECDQERP